MPNKKLFQFEKCLTHLCSYCKTCDETNIHIFCDCKCETVNAVWNELTQYFKGHARLTPLNPQTAIFGLLGMDDENILSKIYYLLLSKTIVYNSRSTGTSVLNVFLIKLSKIKHLHLVILIRRKSTKK